MFLLIGGGTIGQWAAFTRSHMDLRIRWVNGCVVPVLTTDNIEKTHPWTSCDIWKYTDTSDRETDRGHWHNTQEVQTRKD